MTTLLIEKLVFWAGIGHLVLGMGSTTIPRAMQWTRYLQPLRPFFRQMFWTYAGYILAINLFFGILSIWGNQELLNHSFIAKSLTFFISCYWLARLLLQLFCLDKTDAPKGLLFSVGEACLITLFASFTVIYLIAFSVNVYLL